MQSWQSPPELQPAAAVSSKIMEMCPPSPQLWVWAARPSIEEAVVAHGPRGLWVLGNESNKDVQKPLKSPLVGTAAFMQDYPTVQAR